jgi:hypothetical protein
VEALVLGVRARLEENPWSQVGAPAIAWELEKLGAGLPPLRTIERILQRAGVTDRKRPGRRLPKGISYPAIATERAGDVHEADLVGPRHLAGGVRFYALNTVDLAPHRAGIEIVEDKADEGIVRGLVALWDRLGVPARVKFDNGGPFICPRGLGLIVRVCLHQGVTPVFIPQGSPGATAPSSASTTPSTSASYARSASPRSPSSSRGRSPSSASTTPTTATGLPVGARRTSSDAPTRCRGRGRSASCRPAGQPRVASSSYASSAPTASCA